MKSYLRIGAATAAFQSLTLRAVQEVVSDGMVRVGRPFDSSRESQFQGANLYLFHVERNPSFINRDLPTRDQAGNLVQPPQVGVDLYYLMTFYGDEASFVPQSVMANVIVHLHTWPTLLPDELELFDSASSSHIISESGLADQGARVRFTMVPMTVEEITRLWMVFQVPYALTIAIKATVVILEADLHPAEILPVREVRLGVWPAALPDVHLEDSSVGTGDRLTIAIEHGAGRPLTFRIGAQEYPPDSTTATDASLHLTAERITAAGVRAGPVEIGVLGSGRERLGNVTLTLRPMVESATKNTHRAGQIGRKELSTPKDIEVRAQLCPLPGPDQTLHMKLVSDTQVYGPAVATVDDAERVVCSFSGVEKGTWRVVVVVDELDSLPQPLSKRGRAADQIQVP